MYIMRKCVLAAVLCVVLLAVTEAGRTGGGRSRGGSRGSSRGSSSSGGFFGGWFGGSKSSSSSGSSPKKADSGSSSGGWQSPSQSKPAPSWTPQNQPSYGWTVPKSAQNPPKPISNPPTYSYGFQKPPSNPSYPAPASNPSYGFQKPPSNPSYPAPASNPSYGFQKPPSNPSYPAPASNPSQGFPKPSYTPPVPAPAPKNTFTPQVSNQKPGGTSYGWTKPKQPETPKTTNHFQTKPNAAAPPSANIGPGGYPVQSGMTFGQHTPGAGISNAHYRGTAFTYPKQPAYNPGYTHYGGGVGSYGTPLYAQQSYSSNHGFAPSYYPTQNSFGYPGQGMFGNSNIRYGGSGLFGGGSGYYGYPGSGNWGYSNYGTGSSTGSMLKGAAIGAVGGYLVSSMINRATNPWGYSGYGYGNSYGYDRGYRWRRDEYDRYSATTTTPAPRPEDQWIQCVAIDPKTGSTHINPQCSCTVTTSVDPRTNANLTSHYCTTGNGFVVPQPQQPFQLPPQGVNNPNASPNYLNNYGASGYGIYPSLDTVTNQTHATSLNSGVSVTLPIPLLASTEDPKKVDFFSKLEKIVHMGNFTTGEPIPAPGI